MNGEEKRVASQAGDKGGQGHLALQPLEEQGNAGGHLWQEAGLRVGGGDTTESPGCLPRQGRKGLAGFGEELASLASSSFSSNLLISRNASSLNLFFGAKCCGAVCSTDVVESCLTGDFLKAGEGLLELAGFSGDLSSEPVLFSSEPVLLRRRRLFASQCSRLKRRGSSDLRLFFRAPPLPGEVLDGLTVEAWTRPAATEGASAAGGDALPSSSSS